MSLTLPPIPEEYLEIKFLNEDENSIKQNINKEILPFAISNIFLAPVKCAKYLTQSKDVKSVIVVCLNIEGSKMCFEPGQTFGIIPKNSAKEVNQIIERLNLIEVANKTYEISIKKDCNKKNAKIPTHVPIVGTIYNTFINNLDIRSIPKKLFLRALSKYTDDEKEKVKLDELCSKEGTAKYNDFITNNYMTLFELLKIFKNCMPPFSLLFEHLPKLQPRPYSATCVPNLQHELKFIFNVETLPNNYKGTCTGQLEEILTPILKGQMIEVKIPIYFRKLLDFKLPESISTHIIMIANGTGIAPFMSFLEQRKFDYENNSHLGNITLYYGCRFSEKDFLFKSEINKYVETGVIKKLYTAFSRENKEVKYVQHNILNNAEEFIEEMKNNSVVYVCGSAKMCREVFDTVINCFSTIDNITHEDARIICNQYRKVKRYIEDIWT